MNSIGALGISNFESGQALAVTTGLRPQDGETSYEVNKASLRGAMKWELWNPWASFYEIQSTHPLTVSELNPSVVRSHCQVRWSRLRMDLQEEGTQIAGVMRKHLQP